MRATPLENASVPMALAVRIAQTIATPHFFEDLAEAIRAIIPCAAMTIIRHQQQRSPQIIFHDFTGSARDGLNRYIKQTYAYDPFVRALDWHNTAGAYRLRQMPQHAPLRNSTSLVLNREEEIGYRTVGWPSRYEEVGIAVPLDETSIVQIALYRQAFASQAISTFANRELDQLSAWAPLLTVAIGRHRQWESSNPVLDPATELTARESQVVEMVLRGYKSSRIAQQLGISLLTVKSHRKNAYRRLGVETMAGLFALFETHSVRSQECDSRMPLLSRPHQYARGTRLA